MREKIRLVLATLLVLLAWVSSASAADPRSVVVGDIEGERGDAIRDALLVGLAGHDEIRLVALSHAKQNAEKLKADLGDADGVKKVAGRLRLAAFVDGSVKADDEWTATIRVRSGANGEVSESVRFTAKNGDALIAKIQSSAWKQLGPALQEVKPATGSAGGHQVALGPFQGAKAKTVRGYVATALKRAKGIQVVSDASIKQAGIPLGKDASNDDYAGVAAATGATAVLDGRVTTKGRAVTVEIDVRDGASGEVVDTITLKAGWMPGMRNTINKQLAGDLQDPLSKTGAAEAPEEDIPDAAAVEGEAGEEAAGEEEAEEESEPKGRPSALEVGAGIRAFSRNYRYTDDLFDALRSYKLGVAPAAFIYLRWYPVAHFDGGALSHLGLTGGYERGFAVSTETPGGEELDTTTYEWWAGLRYRIPFDEHEVGIQGTYGNHTYRVDDDPADPYVPDVEYTYVRLGVDARVRVSRVVLGAHFGYRYLLGAGQIADPEWFPNISGGGLDAGLLAGYEIIDGLDLLAGFDFRRYFFSMNSEPGDASIAGGALDEYIAGWGGLAFRLPGQASSGDGSASFEAGTGE